MTFLQALILGIVQGLTEFLPISSSAHLVIVPFLLNWKIPAAQIFPFDVLVQMGTLIAVIVYFWQDLWRIIKGVVLGLVHLRPFETQDARLGWLIVLATIPAGLAGLLIKPLVEKAFNSPLATGCFLFITAGLLLLADWLGKQTRTFEQFNWKDALWMGIAQIVSIFPGVSRSGSTITGGVLRQLDRPSAARFSFLMSIPIMLAAGLLEGKDLIGDPALSGFWPLILTGMLMAGIVGYLSIRWLLAFLQRHSLRGFAIYCAAAGTLTVVVALILR